MSAKPQPSPRTLEEINRQIIEIKKKIQLSEGQRKAAFEQYETERKINADQILKLKKEVKELTISLQKNTDESAKHRVRNSRLETIIGPLTNKNTEQVKETLDLQIIDMKKHKDLIKHRIKQRQNYLRTLAEEYQKYLSEKPQEEVVAKLENMFKKTQKKSKKKSGDKKTITEIEIASPYKEKCNDLQNSIHRVEVQWREAEHVRNSYRTIKRTLLEDRANFESILQQLEEKRELQQKDIQELQRMNAEAAATRSTARLALDREERSSLLSSRVRERQASEQEALVAARRQELERLERRIFQSGKGGAPGTVTPASAVPAQIPAVTNKDNEKEEQEEEEEDTESEKGRVDEGRVLKEAFTKLKEATGATSSKDVLSKFQAQRETRTRLDYLKQTTEAEKEKLEKTQEALSTELERYKFAQEQEHDKFGDEIDVLKKKIEDQKQRQVRNQEKLKKKEALREEICKVLYKLYISLKEIGIKINKDITANPEKGHVLVKTLQKEFEEIVKRNNELNEEEPDMKEATEEEVPSDDEMLPSAYNALLRRTPLPVHGQLMQISTPLASGPEDEEEVPSRGFLKRQAQLVVDTKSRRKTIRIPMNRK